ncbi:MAG: hypothetical protein KDJ41_09990 [Hyphomicrobiaceae bacterium]|nr:hypothetical protein [Hyphomicrobiaceae bacterium]
MSPTRCLAAGVLTVLLATVAVWQAAAAPSEVIGRFSDWIALRHKAGGQVFCFAMSKPTAMEPAGVKRGVPHIYVSAWPKDGIRTEFSVKGGYRFKKNTAVQVTIGTATFQLFARNDRAFVRNPTEELKLIEAMKKGSRMTVKGVSEQGTGTTDSYSLIGLSQALQELASGCRKT